MRILVIDSGRGAHAAQVLELRESLGLLPEDEICWLSWYMPKEPLPVLRHLVLGPSLRHLGVARQCETASGTSPSDDIHRDSLPDSAEDVLDPGFPEEQLEEQLTESAQPHHHAEDEPARDVPSSGSVEPAGPARSKGVTYLVKGTRNVLRRTWRPLKTRIVTSDNVPLQVTVGVAQALYPGVGDRFALTAYRSRAVAQMAAECDVVVSHDTRSLRATWVLGRRVSDPALVAGIAAARRVIADRRTAAA